MFVQVEEQMKKRNKVSPPPLNKNNNGNGKIMSTDY